MKVKATRLGYYNHRRRREGDVFELMDDKAFSKRWMERLDGPTAPVPAPTATPKNPAPAKTSSQEVI